MMLLAASVSVCIVHRLVRGRLRQAQSAALLLINGLAIGFVGVGYLLRSPASAVEAAVCSGIGACTGTFGLVTWLVQRGTHASAMTPAVLQDIAAYNQAWQEILADPIQKGALAGLSQLLDTLTGTVSSSVGVCTGLGRPALEGSLEACKSGRISGILASSARGVRGVMTGVGGGLYAMGGAVGGAVGGLMGSLTARTNSFNLQNRPAAEQLVIMMAQAWALNGAFQRIVARLRSVPDTDTATTAAASDQSPNTAAALSTPAGEWNGEGGGDRGRGREGPATEPSPDEESLQPKRRARAIEKVWRSYGGEPVRLRDLVRASLVFGDAQSLLECFQRIVADDALQIQRVKNRFDVAYDANSLSCGYRDLQLSVVVSDLGDEERSMGLHQHPCELQLHLRKIHALKNEDGHRRYVEFRNKRAE